MPPLFSVFKKSFNVLSTPLKRLSGLADEKVPTWPIWLLSGYTAAATGGLLVLFGWLWELLEEFSRLEVLPQWIQIGPRFAIASVWLEADQGILRGVAALLAIILCVTLSLALVSLAIYKTAARTALAKANSHQRAVFNQFQDLSRQRGLAGMQTLLHDLISKDIPAIRDASVRWYRHGPRHLLQAIACMSVGLMIDPLLASLAIIVAVLIRRSFSAIDRRLRRSRPVLLEQRNFAAQQLASWCASSPLLATIHNQSITQEALDAQARPLRTLETSLDDHAAWKLPLMLAMIAIFTCGLLFAAAIRVLKPELELSVIAELILFISISVGIYSATRVSKSLRGLDDISRNIDHLAAFLSQPKTETARTQTLATPMPLTSIELQDVSIDGYDQKSLIKNLNLVLHPGEIVAIVSDKTSDRNSLVELLLGFGTTTRGKLLLNKTSASQLSAQQLASLSCWVAADGPVFPGTVTENLRTAQGTHIVTADLKGALEAARCFEAISALSDGLASVISPNDDRLPADIAFRLGLARAMTLQSAIVVVQEPETFVDNETEKATQLAIKSVAARGVFVVLIPARSKTLWLAQQILFLKDGELIGQGKHTTLLEQNDAYRHWNYMNFSPHLKNG